MVYNPQDVLCVAGRNPAMAYAFNSLGDANNSGFYATFQTIPEIARREASKGTPVVEGLLEKSIAIYARTHPRPRIKILNCRKPRCKFYHESEFSDLVAHYWSVRENA